MLENPLTLTSLSFLERSLSLWNFGKNEGIGLEDSQPVQQLWVPYYDMGLNDKEIICFLVMEGYTVSLHM